MQDGRPFDQALESSLGGLEGRDRRLAHELAAGTLRSASALDRLIAPFVASGLHRVSPAVRGLLRMGAYQLTSLDRVPPHAAVATTVALAQEVGGPRTAGFVNAVLRKVAQHAPGHLSSHATHPGWLVSRWTLRFGAEATARLLRWNDTRPRLTVQPARWSRERLVATWRDAGVGFAEAPLGAGLQPRLSRPRELPGYAEGAFIVQDAAQRLVTEFFAPPRDALLYDACAAPGGKTIALSAGVRRVLATDRRPDRARLLRANLERAGHGNEQVAIADALQPPLRQADAVLLDVPCLGTGVLGRNPDARWRARPEALGRLAHSAGLLLRAAAGTVRLDGLLCFSTCSLEPEENELQIDAFLAEDSRFCRAAGPAPAGLLTAEGDLATLPQRDGIDGAYAARLRRIG